MGLYVQFGCGHCAPDGWLNFDASPTLRLERLPVVGRFIKKNSRRFPKSVRFGDIVRGLPVEPGSASAVYSSHVLEHLSRVDFDLALRQTYRMLRSGGIFRLVVPDLEARARLYITRLEAGEADANDRLMLESGMGVERRSLLSRFGNSAHLWMWDEPSMRRALISVGFVKVRRCRFGDADDPMFALVEDKSRFFTQTFPELAFEARKP